MLEALLIIILLPVAIGVIAMIGGTILGGLAEVFDFSTSGPTPPTRDGPLVPPLWWVYGGTAFCVFALVGALIEKGFS